jgi:hypothetical protein
MSRSSPADRVMRTGRYSFGSTATSVAVMSAGISTMTGACRPFFTWLNARRIAFATCSGRMISSTDLVSEA